MKKNDSPNLPNVINWWWSELNQVDIPPLTQLTMFHIINRLNNNFWKPIKISINQLSSVMNSDRRTVKKALDNLVELGYISEKEGVYSVGYGYYGRYQQSRKSDSKRLDNSESGETSFNQSSSISTDTGEPIQSQSDTGILRNTGETLTPKRFKYFHY